MKKVGVGMSTYDKRKSSQMLYDVRRKLEKEFYSHRLFSMDRELAADLIFKKIGTWYRLIDMGQEERIKKQLNLNFPLFDIIDFFQNGLNEIFKGLISVKKNNENIEQEIMIQDVLELMSIGYKISLFKRYEFFHAKNTVKISYKDNKRINFNYINNEVVKYNITYDVFFRTLETSESIREAEKVNSNNFVDTMNFIHKQMFQIDANIDFGKFDLNKYIEFTTALNILVAKELYRFDIVVNNYGYIKCSIDEWVNKIAVHTELDSQTIKDIILFLIFDFTDTRSDPSLSYFVPVQGELTLLCSFFIIQRLDTNIVKLLKFKDKTKFDKEQKKFETHQINQLKSKIDSRFMVIEGKKALPGVDFLVYNSVQNYLHIIELKFKLPIDSPQEIIKLDQQNLKKALIQNEKASKDINENKVLREYFGDRFTKRSPKKIDYFTITNYSVGLGTNIDLPSPILLIDHYLRCMESPIATSMIKDALNRSDKGLPRNFIMRYSKISIYDYQFVIPVHGAEFINIREFIEESTGSRSKIDFIV